MEQNDRILIVDDDLGIRETYQSILSPAKKADVLSKGASLFNDSDSGIGTVSHKRYNLLLAQRGEEAIKMVEESAGRKEPFAVAFVDMKMPGINGAETAKGIWKIDKNIRIVIVTAYSEYTPDDIIRTTGRDDIFYLRKPFNPEEIRQFARALINDWNLDVEKGILAASLKEANEKLGDMNRNLKDKVEKQTAMMVQSEKMASIGILAAGVAHEINNPISFINGNLSTLKKYCRRITELHKKYADLESLVSGNNQSSADEILKDIKNFKKEKNINFILGDMVSLADESLDGTDRVKNIVQDLKIFSRVDQAEFKHIDINETMDATLNIVWNELKYKAEVEKSYGDIPKVNCFAQKISQVFMNLLMNASQAIDKKGLIKISTRMVKEGQRANDKYVEIKISDTGCGIAQEKISKIFDPFFTTKPVGQGTGLGLSITYDIVKSHGGSITVESKPGEGTAFTVQLPIEQRE